MGEGEEVKTKEEANIHIQERGEIFIFYRPKVNKEEAESEEDVQRLYIVLRPESSVDRPVELKQSSAAAADDDDGRRSGGHGAEEVNIEKERLMRLIVMGRKSLPGPPHSGEKSRPHWGFVELVTTTHVGNINNSLKAEEYETSTRGHRQKPAARAMGEGAYRLLNHISDSKKSNNKTHTHLVYKLQLPTQTHHHDHNSPHRLLNVNPEASFLLQIKNPESATTARFKRIQNKCKAKFPATLQGRFGNQRYIPADPDFLNYEGCELLLISASDDIQKELGLELKTELDQLRDQQDTSSDEDDESLAVKRSSFVHTFGEDCGLPTTPLFQGTWA